MAVHSPHEERWRHGLSGQHGRSDYSNTPACEGTGVVLEEWVTGMEFCHLGDRMGVVRWCWDAVSLSGTPTDQRQICQMMVTLSFTSYFPHFLILWFLWPSKNQLQKSLFGSRCEDTDHGKEKNGSVSPCLSAVAAGVWICMLNSA